MVRSCWLFGKTFACGVVSPCTSRVHRPVGFPGFHFLSEKLLLRWPQFCESPCGRPNSFRLIWYIAQCGSTICMTILYINKCIFWYIPSNCEKSVNWRIAVKTVDDIACDRGENFRGPDWDKHLRGCLLSLVRTRTRVLLKFCVKQKLIIIVRLSTYHKRFTPMSSGGLILCWV